MFGWHHAHAEFRLAQEALDRDGVLRQARPQDLDGGRAALGMLGPIHSRGATLADMLEEAVAGHGAADEIVWLMGVQEGTRRRRHRQAGSVLALDRASAQGLTFACTARPAFPPAPEGGPVLRLRLSRCSCSSPPAVRWQRVGATSTAPSPEETLTSLFNLPAFYQRMGRLAAGPPLPFVGTVAFAAGPGDSVIGDPRPLPREPRPRLPARTGNVFVARYRVELLARVARARPPIRFARDEEVRVADVPGDPADRRERALPAAASTCARAPTTSP